MLGWNVHGEVRPPAVAGGSTGRRERAASRGAALPRTGRPARDAGGAHRAARRLRVLGRHRRQGVRRAARAPARTASSCSDRRTTPASRAARCRPRAQGVRHAARRDADRPRGGRDAAAATAPSRGPERGARPGALPRGRAAVPPGHARRRADRADPGRSRDRRRHRRGDGARARAARHRRARWWWSPPTSPTTASRTATRRSPRDKRARGPLLDLGRATAERAAAIDARGFVGPGRGRAATPCAAPARSQVLLELLSHAFSGTGQVVDVTTSAAVLRQH